MSTVLLVENLPILREGLRERVAACGHQVVGEADNGQDALRMCRELQPQLVILELAIPRLGGLDVLRRLRASAPDIRLLVFSSQESEVYAGRSQQAGADAFVSKSEPVSELENALAAITHGRTYFPRQTPSSGAPAGTEQNLKDELQRLSARELTVLQMLCLGLSNKAISDQLSLSYKTISTYKVRLHQKLGVSSDFQLMQVARAHGLVDDASGLPTDDTAAQGGEELELLRALLDSTPTPMFVRDPQGRLLLCNRPYLRLAGGSFETVRGTPIEEAQWIPLPMRQQAWERFHEAVRRQEPFMLELALEHADGPSTLYAWCLPHRSAAGELIAMVGGMRSLSERDSLLAELRHESLAAQFRSRLKSGALQLIRNELNEQLAELRACSAGVEPAAAHRLTQCVVQFEALALRIDELLTLEDQDDRAQREARHLGQLTLDLLAPLRQPLEAAGYALDLNASVRGLKAAWIDVVHYRHLLEGLLAHAQLLQPPTRLSLHLSNRPYLKGYLRLTLELSPWPSAKAESGKSLEWSQARLQGALNALSADSQVATSKAGEPMMQVHIDLPLAMDT